MAVPLKRVGNETRIPSDIKVQFTFQGERHSLYGASIDGTSSGGAIVDIGVSWIIFCYPETSPEAAVLLPGSELEIHLISPRRTVNANSRIVRYYKVKNSCYFGCRFLNMEPEDSRFLFEYLYEKPCTDKDVRELFGNFNF